METVSLIGIDEEDLPTIQFVLRPTKIFELASSALSIARDLRSPRFWLATISFFHVGSPAGAGSPGLDSHYQPAAAPALRYSKTNNRLEGTHN